MTRIRVTPEELFRASQRFAEIAGRVNDVAGDLSAILNELNPGDYEGQFYSAVAGRIGQAQGIVGSIASKLATHSQALSSRGRAFQTADEAAISKVSYVGSQIRQWTGSQSIFARWADFAKLPLYSIATWLGLGRLVGSTRTASTPIVELIDPKRLKISPPTSIRTYSSSLPSDFAVRVPADGGAGDKPISPSINKYREAFGTGRFYRFGSDLQTKRDCTWYAAAATKTASNGEIDLNSIEKTDKYGIGKLGNAGEWPGKVSQYWGQHKDDPNRIFDGPPDKYPKERSLLVKGDHVAFIEAVDQIKIIDPITRKERMEWKVTVSEENYDGGAVGANPTPIKLEGHPEVERWRSEYKFQWKSPTDSSVADENVQFIHPRYRPEFKLDFGYTVAGGSAQLKR